MKKNYEKIISIHKIALSEEGSTDNSGEGSTDNSGEESFTTATEKTPKEKNTIQKIPEVYTNRQDFLQ